MGVGVGDGAQPADRHAMAAKTPTIFKRPS